MPDQPSSAFQARTPDRLSPGSLLRRAGTACTVAAGGVALVGLLAWTWGGWQAVSFGPGYVPMAPSAAVALILLSGAVGVVQRWSSRPAAARAAVSICFLVGAAGLMILAENLLGWEHAIEWWGNARVGESGIPVGRVAPLSAEAFLATALAVLCWLPPLARRRMAGRIGGTLAAGVLLLALAILLGYASGAPVHYGGATIPMALLTSLSLVLLSLGLLLGGRGVPAAAVPKADPAAARPRLELQRFEWRLLGVLACLLAAIALSGWFFLRQQIAEARQSVQQQLLAIADLKVRGIADWRAERLGDVRTFFKAGFVSSSVQRLLADPASASLRTEVRDWLTLFREQYSYGQIALFDAEARLRLFVGPTGIGPEPSLAQHAVVGLRSREAVLTDLDRSQATGEIHLDLAFPILPPTARPGEDGGTPLGALVFRVDPRQYLYPLIQSWPMPSRTAETLLVRRDGDDVLYLNELRFAKNTALSMRRPIAEARLPAAVGLRGWSGVLEGADYRGVEVVAAVRPVPASPWVVVAKVDQDEIYAPMRDRAAATIASVIVLLLAAALGVGLLWRHQSARLLEGELDAEQRTKAMAERVLHLSRQVNDIILLADKDQRIVEANDRALEAYGYTLAELRQMTVRELYPPESRSDIEVRGDGGEPARGAIFETRHCRRDGTAFPVEVSARTVTLEGETYSQAIIRDITERKRAEEALREQTLELQHRNLELDAFAQTVAHDLKAPLSITTGNAELLSLHFDSLSPDRRRAVLEAILRNSQRMANIIDELLLLSEVRKSEVTLHLLDTPALLAEARERLAGLIASSQAEIVTASQWPAALGYGPWVAEVWMNYLSNALRYGGRPPRVELGAATQPDAMVRFWVRDNGNGIPPERQAQLFAPFTRFEQVRTLGHGLGLSIVRRILEKLGGQFGVESTGQGSLFYFCLPGADNRDHRIRGTT